MLARSHRLRQAPDIARVYKKGSYGGVHGIVSVKALVSGRTETRIVVVVSKKIDKRATVRNLIRRRIIGHLERIWATVRPGYDIVISVHSNISELPAEVLGHHLDHSLQRAGVSTT